MRSRPIRGHGRRKRRLPVWGLVIVLVGLAALGVGLRFLPGSSFVPHPGSQAGGQDDPTPTPTPTPAPLPFHVATVTVPDLGKKSFVSWALMDRRSGEIWGSPTMDQTTWTASMIKGWLAADYLRRQTEAGRTPSSSWLHTLETMIRDSDNAAGTRTYNADGKTASIKRLITICKLADSSASTEGWGFTSVSARDTVKMADCIANGTAAGPTWTPTLLGWMRTVRGQGDFGIRHALPPAQAAQVSIKNGWLPFTDDHLWHINCMAVGDTWAMAVLLRYPSAHYPGEGDWNVELPKGEQLCQQVATELLNPAAQ